MTIVCEPALAEATALADRVGHAAHPVTDIRTLNDVLGSDPTESVVVLGSGLDLPHALEITRWLRGRRQPPGVILLRRTLEIDDVLAAMREGVREVLDAADDAALTQACQRYEQPVQAVETGHDRARRGHLVTVFSAKGGCGKTTLATNMSVVLGQAGRRVCLVDLDLTFGDVAITLGLTPRRTISDVAGLGEALDEAKVASLLTPYLPGIDCLLAPVAPGEAERIPVAATAGILAVLSGMYDFVVIDTPAQVSEHVLAALDASHQHILLTTPEVPALKNLRVTLDMLDLLSYDRGGRTIVLNRSDADVGLSQADIMRVVKTPIAGHIPSSRDVTVAINKGVPLASSLPDHPVSAAVRALVAGYIDKAGAEQPAVAASRRGGLRRRRRAS